MKTIAACLFLVALPLQAAPAGVSDRAIDLEVKRVKLFNLFRLLSDVGKVNVVPDACVKDDEVDLKLKNTPVSVVFDVLGVRLGLTYRMDGGILHVGCRDQRDARLEVRVSVGGKGTLKEVAESIAQQAGLGGVACTAGCDDAVSLAASNIRLETALLALSEMTGRRVVLMDGKLVVQ
jgi:hypothetical protein